MAKVPTKDERETQLSYLVPDVEQEPDFEVPSNFNFKRDPEELITLMGKASYEFEQANRKMREIQALRSMRMKQVMIILLSKSVDLLQTEKLRKHLEKCLLDPKFKYTNDILDAFVYIELKDLMARYERYEAIAKQAEKEHDMWSRQLSWHQSKLKKETAEISSYGGGHTGG